MGNVKSFRMSEKAENMFGAIKKYYSKCNKEMSDSQLISFGIENLFIGISEKANKDYKSKVQLKLQGKQKKLFDRMCDLLENIALDSGNFLEDEVKYFICYTQRFNENFDLLSHEDTSKMNVFRYDVIESKLAYDEYTENDFRDFAQFLKNNYEK